MSLDPNLVQAANSNLVPASFAEKAMASLMQLHEDLCAEKEKRVDLYRQLMEKEQALAELAMYVRLLEERLEGEKGAVGAVSAASDAAARGTKPAESVGQNPEAPGAIHGAPRTMPVAAAHAVKDVSVSAPAPGSSSAAPVDPPAPSLPAARASSPSALNVASAPAPILAAPSAAPASKSGFAASAAAVALAPELPVPAVAAEMAARTPPRPPEVSSGPARQAPARSKPDDWKVW